MVCVWVAVKLCDRLVTHRPYLSALDIKSLHNTYKSQIQMFTLLYFIVLSQ